MPFDDKEIADAIRKSGAPAELVAAWLFRALLLLAIGWGGDRLGQVRTGQTEIQVSLGKMQTDVDRLRVEVESGRADRARISATLEGLDKRLALIESKQGSILSSKRDSGGG